MLPESKDQRIGTDEQWKAMQESWELVMVASKLSMLWSWFDVSAEVLV